MFEVPEPASNHRTQLFNDGAQARSSRAFCLLAYLVFEGFETFAPHPAPSCLEAVDQKFEALPFFQTFRLQLRCAPQHRFTRHDSQAFKNPIIRVKAVRHYGVTVRRQATVF